jgi:hypothetical protein
MKKLLLLAGICCNLVASAQHFYFIPNTYAPATGSYLAFHMYKGDDFLTKEEYPLDKSRIASYRWATTKSDLDLLPSYQDSTLPAFNGEPIFTGQGVLSMERLPLNMQVRPEYFVEFLKKTGREDLLKIHAALPQRQMEHERRTQYMKSLVTSGNVQGLFYKKQVGHKLDITLLTNPYLKTIGDTVVAQVFFQGKPLAGANLEASSMDNQGITHRQPVITNKNGKCKFTLDRKGDCILSVIYITQSTSNDFDWDSYRATYTFGVK